MAKFIYSNRSTLFNKPQSNMLEVFEFKFYSTFLFSFSDFYNNNNKKIGAGTSLPTLVAYKYCNLKKLFVTDRLVENQRLVELIRETLDKNKIANYSIDLLSNPSLVNYETNEDDDDDDDDESKILVKDLNWSNFRSLFSNKFPKLDILIGSDVFFDTKRKHFIICDRFIFLINKAFDFSDFEDLIANIAFLIESNNPDLVFYTTFAIRK